MGILPERKLTIIFLSAATALLVIGVLNVAAEMSKPVKESLTLDKGIGPYSGKVLFGYLAGIFAVIPNYFFLRRIAVRPMIGFAVLVAALVLATLLVFTPFVHLFVKA